MVSSIKIQYEKPRIVAKLVYPQLNSDESDQDNLDQFNQIILALVQDEITQFKNQAIE